MTRLQRIMVGTCAVALVFPTVLVGKETLRMRVSPAAARAPATVTIHFAFDANANDRFLRVTAESPAFYRSSQVDLDGSNAPASQTFEFHNLPAGRYEITGVLGGVQGKRAAAVRLVEVLP